MFVDRFFAHMLFNFTLVPVEQVPPWGSPGELRLSWFGLTDGQYWIQAGDAALLEFSEQSRSKFDWPRYCDYQVARLYEDVLEMAPDVLEIVPDSFVPYISGESGAAWKAKSLAWTNDADEQDEMRNWEATYNSTAWIGRRKLDTSYLSPSSNIRMWSDEASVHIEWDHSDCMHDGLPVWSANQGSYRLSRDAFKQEVRSFHDRLMEQMTERVERVLAGALSPQVQVDLVGLQKEHSIRCLWPENVFGGTRDATDWQSVRKAIAEIERGTCSRL